MIYLAGAKSSVPIPLGDIAIRHGQSLSYLEQIFAQLLKAGLVESVRGPGGGYKVVSLESSVSDIVLAIDGKLPEPEDLPEDQKWADLSQQTHEFWKSRTLADLII
jgi:Rrf2 family iron-sulfur cluster assembly transcriptional regulator